MMGDNDQKGIAILIFVHDSCVRTQPSFFACPTCRVTTKVATWKATGATLTKKQEKGAGSGRKAFLKAVLLERNQGTVLLRFSFLSVCRPGPKGVAEHWGLLCARRASRMPPAKQELLDF